MRNERLHEWISIRLADCGKTDKIEILKNMAHCAIGFGYYTIAISILE